MTGEELRQELRNTVGAAAEGGRAVSETSDTVPETFRQLANGLAAMTREFEPILRGLRELTALVEPFTRMLSTAAPFLQEVVREQAKLGTAESLLEQGWVPNHTTPFDLVAECEDDGARLQTALLAHYTDRWGEVRVRLEKRLDSSAIDDEAKATFREALDAHEAGLYRSVSRVLFPEFERVFREALPLAAGVGSINYKKFMKKLSGTAANLELGDFLIAGIQDMVLFNYLTEDDSRSASSEYVPTLAVGINKRNVEQARQNPIPTRHAVVHGLVTYSSRQSSLNAIFIADYVFSVMSRARAGLTGPGA